MDFLAAGLVAALLIPPTLAAQTAPSDAHKAPSPHPGVHAIRLAPDTPHADASGKVCLYAVTLPVLMPNFTCEQKTSRYFGNLSG